MPISRRCAVGPDSGEHQQLRGVDGAGGDDHLAARRHRVVAGEVGALVAHPGGARLRRRTGSPTPSSRCGPRGSSGCPGSGAGTRATGRAAGCRPRSALIWNQPAPLRTVSPRLNATVGSPTCAAASSTAAPQGSSGGTSRSTHASSVSRSDQRQHVGSAPHPVAPIADPLVERLGGRQERDARVVRRAAAEHLGPGVAHERVAALLRFDRVVPVVAGVEQVHPVRQHQDGVVADVGRARLDQADGHVGILGQPRGEHAPGGAATGDDVVEVAVPGVERIRQPQPLPRSRRRATSACRCGCGP